MRYFMRCIVIVGVYALSAVTVRADSWSLPEPRIVMASDDRTGVKVLPDSDGAAPTIAEVFRLRSNGALERLWRQPLVNTPVDIYVAPLDHGGLVTLDTWHGTGFNHSLVVYGKDGKVLADYELEDLLSPEEIRQHTGLTSSSRRWRDGFTAGFEGHPFSGPFAFIVRLPWGKTIKVDVATGKLIPVPTPEPGTPPSREFPPKDAAPGATPPSP